MKRLVLKESQAVYTVNIVDTDISDEVVLLEKEGQPVAALLPLAEYKAYQSWREAETSGQFRHRGAAEEAIDREHAAFAKMLPELMKKYDGKVVAIHNGEVIADGNGRMDVWLQARQKVGEQPVYVQTVAKAPRVHKMPHRKVIANVGL